MNSTISDIKNLIPYFYHIVNRYCDTNWINPTSAKKYHTFFYVLSGEGICHSEVQDFPISKDMLIYHGANKNYGFSTSKDNLLHILVAYFDLFTCTNSKNTWGIEKIYNLPLDKNIILQNKNIFKKHFLNLTEIWDEATPNKTLKCQGIFINMLCELLPNVTVNSNNSIPVPSVKSLKGINEAITYIQKNYTKKITIQDLSKIADLAPNYFISSFKKIAGMTPIEMINTLRIEKSIEYLMVGYSVKETSFLLSFSDQYYFSKIFKKIKNTSPSNYVLQLYTSTLDMK